ncbi:MAG: condensation domain-containing protein, partial [Methylocystis sp.]
NMGLNIQSLTVAQRGIYFGHLLDESGCAYNLVQYLDIRGDFKPDIFARSIQFLLASCPSLFSVIRLSQNSPSLYIGGSPGWFLPEHDLSQLANPMEEFTKWARAERVKSFDLEKGPLFNWQLFKLADKHFVFFQSYHHILVDGASVYYIDRKLFHTYANLLQQSHVEEEPIATSALIAENLYLSSIKFQEDCRFWAKEFGLFDLQSSLSGKLASKSLLANRQSYRLPATITKKLRYLSSELNLALPRLLIAICAVYYSRTVGREKILIEIPVACRNGYDELLSIDMRSNISILRLEIRNCDTLADVCRHVTQRLRSLSRHQYYRHEYLKDEYSQSEEMAFFQINILPEIGISLPPQLVVSRKNISLGQVRDFNIAFYSEGNVGEIELIVDGNAERYTNEELKSHLSHIINLLKSMIDMGVNEKVCSFCLIDDYEATKLLTNFNNTHKILSSWTLCSLFSAQVERTPEAIALIFGDEEVSYQELDRRANQLARYLIEQNIGPEDI